MEITKYAIFPINEQELGSLLKIKALPPVPKGVTNIFFEEESRKATITMEVDDSVTDITPHQNAINDWVKAVNEACDKQLGVVKLHLELEQIKNDFSQIKANHEVMIDALEDMGRIERLDKGIKRKGKK